MVVTAMGVARSSADVVGRSGAVARLGVWLGVCVVGVACQHQSAEEANGVQRRYSVSDVRDIGAMLQELADEFAVSHDEAAKYPGVSAEGVDASDDELVVRAHVKGYVVEFAYERSVPQRPKFLSLFREGEAEGWSLAFGTAGQLQTANRVVREGRRWAGPSLVFDASGDVGSFAVVQDRKLVGSLHVFDSNGDVTESSYLESPTPIRLYK